MQLLLSTSWLESVGGSETYVTTVADQLQRLGHQVWLHAEHCGAAADAARALGVRVCAGREGLPGRVDALIVQDAAVACELAAGYPGTPQVFVAHSDMYDLQLPPQLDGIVSVVVALYDRVERRLRGLAAPVEVVRLSQPIDVERFKPMSPLRARPAVALALSNYLHGERLAALARACAECGIELRTVGSLASGGPQAPSVPFGEVDIVFGKARVILEAMACGRAAYVFDHNGADGWVTAANFHALAADNFGGQSGTGAADPAHLVADLARYDPAMGLVNRDLVVAHHSASAHAAALAEIVRRAVGGRPPESSPLEEIARVVRIAHRSDVRAFVLHAETERLAARIHALEAELASCRAGHRELSAAADAARAETARHDAAAADAWRRLHEIWSSRRWQVMQAALRPADRLRRGRTGTH